MSLSMDFAPDIEEGQKRLSGKELTHFKSRVEKAAHILEELTAAGIDPTKKIRALFAGSGVGLIPYILARHTAWEIHGGDLNKAYLTRYPWVRERINILYLDATEMPFPDNSFDVVVCNHVIEHVYAWEKLASESYRVVKKAGLFYVATPNLHGLYRTDVPLKVLLLKILFRHKKKIARDVRITLHMGLSPLEIERLLAAFSHLETLNRTHILINCPMFLRPFLLLVPAQVYRRFAPNHVVIARK